VDHRLLRAQLELVALGGLQRNHQGRRVGELFTHGAGLDRPKVLRLD